MNNSIINTDRLLLNVGKNQMRKIYTNMPPILKLVPTQDGRLTKA